ncbi:hypothetical protein like AT4G29090 [Hibiscus trionum]|uniref:Reverse transcriptase zinc-binding domain-containing protein n=1 Tax=Hibiscus trionum TaxID=183268 RepID=A0A9W7LHU9_HIBTR|nr:hypothetical protein like AT4G29090 [Hibiscus trionum]
MSLFHMPVSVSTKLNGLIAKFIWGGLDKKTIHWLCWSTLCKPKLCGGLGLCDLKTKNSALLNKWLWRYGTEYDKLWRRVINAKYEDGAQWLLPRNSQINNRKSWIWRNIAKPLSDPADVFAQHLRLTVGDGSRIDFWNDKWTGNESLKERFPRVYALAVQKQGCIAEFGNSNNGRWVWAIQLRRSLFDWEKEVWTNFQSLLEQFKPGLIGEDSVRWDASTNGFYKPAEFRQLLENSSCVNDPVWKIVWSNLAPPSVEAFVWKLIHGRIPTRTELVKRGINSI